MTDTTDDSSEDSNKERILVVIASDKEVRAFTSQVFQHPEFIRIHNFDSLDEFNSNHNWIEEAEWRRKLSEENALAPVVVIIDHNVFAQMVDTPTEEPLPENIYYNEQQGEALSLESPAIGSNYIQQFSSSVGPIILLSPNEEIQIVGSGDNERTSRPITDDNKVGLIEQSGLADIFITNASHGLQIAPITERIEELFSRQEKWADQEISREKPKREGI